MPSHRVPTVTQVQFYVDGDTPIHVAGPKDKVGHLCVGSDWEATISAARCGNDRTGMEKLQDIHAWFSFVTAELATAILEAGGTIGDSELAAPSAFIHHVCDGTLRMEGARIQ